MAREQIRSSVQQYREDRAAIREALVAILDDVSRVHARLHGGDQEAALEAATTLKTRAAAVQFLCCRIADRCS